MNNCHNGYDLENFTTTRSSDEDMNNDGERKRKLSLQDSHEGTKVNEENDTKQLKLGVAEKSMDIDQPFGYVDIKKLEHSARMLQKNMKIIIDDAPTISELNKLLEKEDLDNLTYDNLKTNKLVHLSSQLKSLYERGDLKIFDSILNNNIDDEKIENINTEDNKDQSTSPSILEPLPPSPKVIINRKTTDDDFFDDDNNDKPFPTLPEIKDPHLYSRVFIHKSTMNNKSYLYQSELISSHNERLEFLGDSVLNNLATLILYERYPTAPEGELSKMRSSLVNNVTLAEFSIQYGFDKKLKSNINDAILRQGKQKIFADIFEAYLGALAMEHQLDSQIIKNWLYRLFLPRLNQFDQDINVSEEVNKDAKSELYSLVGTAAFHPQYKVVKSGDGASKPFMVNCVMGNDILGTGEAPGLKEAGLRAAMKALKNKALLEKYTQLRLNTDKAQSAISNKTGHTEESFKQYHVPQGIQLPLIADSSTESDSDARNKVYALLSKNYNTSPEYICNETDSKTFTAELKISSTTVAVGIDASKKKAMAKAAKVVLDNPKVLGDATL